MFAGENKLLAEAVENTKQASLRQRSDSVSSYDEQLDLELTKLVVVYKFNFEMIALHLQYKMPKYGSRINSRMMALRWNQLYQARNNQRHIATGQKTGQKGGEEAGNKEIGTVGLAGICEANNKKSRQKDQTSYEIALRQAETLDEQEQLSFILYRPKFIMDSQYKLEREDNLSKLQTLIKNEHNYEFGHFEGQSCPIQLRQIEKDESTELNPQDHSADQLKCQQTDSVEGNQYLDGDWQDYDSD